MKTAIDFYERGKLKEANADEYNRAGYYSKNRFICPECGEAVHLTGSKYSNFFSHYKKTDISAECERRVDAVPTSSLYQRMGLPLYLRCENRERFGLYIGFKKISEQLLEYDYPTFHLSMDCFWAEIVSGGLVLKGHEAAKWLTKDELDSVEWLSTDIMLIETVKSEI